MSIYEFLERLEADPFDPELDALFLGKTKENAEVGKTNEEERT